VLADAFDVNDANAAEVSVLGARGHDTHLAAVPVDDLVHLELVIKPRHRAFSGSAVDVNDVIESICHGRFGTVWALIRPQSSMRMRGLEPPRGFPHTDLNRARLPIPPHPRGGTV
jgi:hypothetical protein